MKSKLDDKPIVIIGGGPAGYKSALELRKQFVDQEIILYEKNKLGGACLHVGCIPSKLLHSIKSLDEYPRFIKKHKMILEKAIASELKNANIQVINEEAKVEELEYSHLILATGSKPRVLVELPDALTSDSFFSEENMKKGFNDKYCFIGGGYIGIEIASMLAKHGKQVRILEMQDEILGFVDPFIRNKLIEELQRSKITISTGIKDLSSINFEEDEEVFVSIGRESNLPVGASLGNPNIHILGDASCEMPLAHYAYAQARELAYKLAGKKYPEIDKLKVPQVIFTHPELASIGLNSDQAIEKFGENNFEELLIPWASNGKARISGYERGFTKWIIHEDKVAGCHIIGHSATDLISILVPIINMNPSIEEMKKWIYPHPTLGEIFMF